MLLQGEQDVYSTKSNDGMRLQAVILSTSTSTGVALQCKMAPEPAETLTPHHETDRTGNWRSTTASAPGADVLCLGTPEFT